MPGLSRWGGLAGLSRVGGGVSSSARLVGRVEIETELDLALDQRCQLIEARVLVSELIDTPLRVADEPAHTASVGGRCATASHLLMQRAQLVALRRLRVLRLRDAVLLGALLEIVVGEIAEGQLLPVRVCEG